MKSVLITGPQECGKTTLLKLLTHGRKPFRMAYPGGPFAKSSISIENDCLVIDEVSKRHNLDELVFLLQCEEWVIDRQCKDPLIIPRLPIFAAVQSGVPIPDWLQRNPDVIIITLASILRNK